jgi:hypothetical protein
MNSMFSHSAAPAAGLSTPPPDTACALMVAASLLLAELERGRAIDAKALRTAMTAGSRSLSDLGF